jgi:CRISPR-associated protein Csh1
MKLTEKLSAYLEERNSIYGDGEKSLFWLGYLTAMIGVEQRNRGGRKEAILNKLKFEGMKSCQIQQYYNQIFDQLHIYGLLNSENEVIYAESKALLEKHMPSWSLNFQENLFFILSGYAITKRLMHKKED